jgi:hypothetical protein
LTANEVSPCTGCVSDSLQVEIMDTGTDHLVNGQLNVQIFPNPAKDLITLSANILKQEQFVIEFFNGEGKSIFKESFVSANSNFEKKFDLFYLDAGIYFVKLQTGDLSKTTKLIIVP